VTPSKCVRGRGFSRAQQPSCSILFERKQRSCSIVSRTGPVRMAQTRSSVFLPHFLFTITFFFSETGSACSYSSLHFLECKQKTATPGYLQDFSKTSNLNRECAAKASQQFGSRVIDPIQCTSKLITNPWNPMLASRTKAQNSLHARSDLILHETTASFPSYHPSFACCQLGLESHPLCNKQQRGWRNG
jgi:hypothetical protein